MVIVVVEILGPGPESIRMKTINLLFRRKCRWVWNWPVPAEIPCRPGEVPHGCDYTIALKPSNGRS